MAPNFYDLPWFVRDEILYIVLAARTSRFTIHNVNGEHIFRTDPPLQMYHALQLVSKSIRKESRLALLRTSAMLLQRLEDLEFASRVLSIQDRNAVRAVVVKAICKYEHDGQRWSEKFYECTEITYASIKNVFANLTSLHIDQDPGSKILQTEVPFEKVVNDLINENYSGEFMNGWGWVSDVTKLVNNAYDAMGSRVLEWYKIIITEARKDQVLVEVTAKFRCSAHPKLDREEVVGMMNAEDKFMVVRRNGEEIQVPQEFHFDINRVENWMVQLMAQGSA